MTSNRTNVWKSKTCKSCDFREDRYCYRLPPATGNTAYEKVLVFHQRPHERGGVYRKACAEWQPVENLING